MRYTPDWVQTNRSASMQRLRQVFSFARGAALKALFFVGLPLITSARGAVDSSAGVTVRQDLSRHHDNVADPESELSVSHLRRRSDQQRAVSAKRADQNAAFRIVN